MSNSYEVFFHDSSSNVIDADTVELVEFGSGEYRPLSYEFSANGEVIAWVSLSDVLLLRKR